MDEVKPQGFKVGLGRSKPFFASVEAEKAWEESFRAALKQADLRDCPPEVKTDTGILCRRCRLHHIIETKTRKYFGPPALLKFGPDTWRQLTPVLILSCERCGVIYQYPP
ncbi:MAG: hypothetical protein WDZ85_00580 [Candidatus Paceibacterota bacterium]